LSLQAAAQFPQYRFARSTITSASLEAPSYLRQLAAFPLPDSAQHCLAQLPARISRAQCGHQLIAAVSSEHDVKLYNYTVGGGSSGAPSSLEAFSVLRGHKRAVQDVAFHNVHVSFDAAQVQTAQGRCMLSTASEDGTIKFWDVRQQQPALDIKRQFQTLWRGVAFLHANPHC
jgi:WD40 repeat protein